MAQDDTRLSMPTVHDRPGLPPPGDVRIVVRKPVRGAGSYWMVAVGGDLVADGFEPTEAAARAKATREADACRRR